MKYNTRIALFAVITFLVVVSPVRAITLLDVGGESDSPYTFDSNQAVAISFSLDSVFNNVSISSSLICGACSFSAFLMQDSFGPNAPVANLVQAVNFDAVPFGGELFSELNLVADDYYVVIANTGPSSIIWEGGTNPTVSSAVGVNLLENWASTLFDQTFAPTSTFDVFLDKGTRFFSVSSEEVYAVPEPRSVFLLVIGLGLISMIRRAKIRS